MKSGFSFVEIIITMTIIAVMTVGASMYYGDVIDRTNRDKAMSDLKQIKKVLIQYDSELPSGLTTYTQISESPEIRDLRLLVQVRKMPDLPSDPWGNEYRIDIDAGIIYSMGPDPDEGYDYYRFVQGLPIEESISRAMDDIIVRYKPRFEAERAELVETRYRGRVCSLVLVDFTRPVDYSSVTTDTSFTFTSASTSPPDMTTATVNIQNQREVKIRMDGILDVNSSWRMTISSATIRSVDNAHLETDTVLDIYRPHEM